MDVYLQPIHSAKFAVLYGFSHPKPVTKIPLLYMASMPGARENWFDIHKVDLEFLLLDIREPQERINSGNISNAIHCPRGMLEF